MSDEDNGPPGVVKKFLRTPRLTVFFYDQSSAWPMNPSFLLDGKRLMQSHASVFG